MKNFRHLWVQTFVIKKGAGKELLQHMFHITSLIIVAILINS